VERSASKDEFRIPGRYGIKPERQGYVNSAPLSEQREITHIERAAEWAETKTEREAKTAEALVCLEILATGRQVRALREDVAPIEAEKSFGYGSKPDDEDSDIDTLWKEMSATVSRMKAA